MVAVIIIYKMPLPVSPLMIRNVFPTGDVIGEMSIQKKRLEMVKCKAKIKKEMQS